MAHKLSILIPCYNSEKTIIRCLASINIKKFKNEIIVCIINDGSTDNSLSIINDYIKTEKITNITVTSRKNIGLALTRHELIHSVKTEFFIFLDADDFFVDNAITSFLEAVKFNPDICLFKTIRKTSSTKYSVYSPSRKLSNNKLSLVNQNFFPFWNMIIRTKYILDLNIKIFARNCEDWGVTDYLILSAEKIIFKNEYTYLYDNASSQISKAKISDEEFIETLYQQLQNLFIQIGRFIDIKSFYKQKISYWNTYIFLWVLRNNLKNLKYGKAIKWCFTYKNSKLHSFLKSYGKPKLRVLSFIFKFGFAKKVNILKYVK